jgi:inosine-uridine nucleoside N-ribohydrolase
VHAQPGAPTRATTNTGTRSRTPSALAVLCAARLRATLVLIVVLAFGVAVVPTVRASAAPTRVPVILDTDIYTSADDVGALATLFASDLTGVDNVIAVGVNTPYYRSAVSTDSWKCAAAIAQFYGYPNVPIGSDMPDNGPPPPSSDDFTAKCAADASPETPAPGNAVEVYRKALASQADGSVVIVCTGYEENLDNLLQSPPDSISPLSGKSLIAAKVSRLVVMGGGYPSRSGENNFEGDAGAASYVAQHWPTKVVYSGYEVGDVVYSGQTVTSVHPSDSPVRAAIEEFTGGLGKAIMSFDLTAAYHAIYPSDLNLSEVGPGTNVIDSVGDNTFTTGPGDEYYLALGSVSGLEASLETMWDTLPGTTSQGLSITSSPPSPANLGGSYGVAVSEGATGNPVTLTIDPSSTSGCTINGTTVSLSAPTGSCMIDANEPGSTTYAPGVASQTIQVTKVAQSISFTSSPPANPALGSTYTVTATGGGSPNPVTFSNDASSTSGCTVSSSGKVTFLAPIGSCVIDANQAGNSTFAAASEVQQTIDLGGLGQTVSFTSTAPSPATVGAPGYSPTASSSAGLGVTITLDAHSSGCSLNGGVVTFQAVGTCVLDATQAGNATYKSASLQQSIPVTKGTSRITIVTGAPRSPRAGGTYVPRGRSSTGDTVLISLAAHSTACGMLHGTVELRSAGSCAIDFTDPGNANYLGSTVTQQVVIAKGHVQLLASATPSPAHAGAVVSLSGTVSVAYATGIVTFSAGGKTLCAAAVHAGVATCRAPMSLPKGSYRISASYSGSASFLAKTASTRIRLI